MKKRLLCFVIALCMVCTLLPVSSGAAGLEMMQIGKEMQKSWSSYTEECTFLVEITEAGFYDLTIRDYYGYGVCSVDFFNDEYFDYYYDYYICHYFCYDTEDRYTHKNLYLVEGIYELNCAYFDEYYDSVDASIGLTLTRNDSYSATKLSSSAAYVSFEPDEYSHFEFRSKEAGDYIINCSKAVDAFACIFDKNSLEQVEYIYDIGKTSGYRVRLEADTDYLMVCFPWSADSIVAKMSISKASKNVVDVSVDSCDAILPNENTYSIPYNCNLKISYSDGSSTIISYDDLMYSSDNFDVEMEYSGETIYTSSGEELLKPGWQDVTLLYLNTESKSKIYVTSFTEYFDYLDPIDEFDDMLITYEDEYTHTYYWHLRPSYSGYYSLYSRDGWDTTFDFYNLTIFDKSGTDVSWDDDEFFLSGGEDYCLRFEYTYNDEEYFDFTFWLEKTEDIITPSAPTVKITTSSGCPMLTWNAVNGATKYWIYRSTDGKNFSYYDSTTKTSYTNSSTTIGKTYYYKVKAVKVLDGSDIASDYSAAMSIMRVPVAPTVSISRVNGKPKLTWNAVSGATKYWIYRSTDGVNYKYFDSTTKTSYTNSGAASGTKYYYKVKAVAVVNGNNITSSYSSAKSLVTTPAVPTVSITTSDGKPKLTWNAVSGATKYWIYRSTDGKNFSYYDSTTKTGYTNSSITIGKTYYYKVKAVKSADGSDIASDYSAAKSITCAPAAPTVSISRVNGKPKLTWNAVSGATKYWIYRSTDGVNYKYFDSTTKTSYTNSGAASGTKYYYKVKAVAVVNGNNITSSYSSAKSLLTTLATPTVNITTSSGKPKVTWNSVTGADKYYIYRSTDGKTFSYFDSTTKTSYTNTGAKKNTKYYYKVKAVCANNSNANSSQSKTVSIKATK